MRPRSGVFLVASPELTDANFARSVIYLLDHNDTGSLGFILNRPLDLPLGELWSDAPGGLIDARIAAEGGPVDKHMACSSTATPRWPEHSSWAKASRWEEILPPCKNAGRPEATTTGRDYF